MYRGLRGTPATQYWSSPPANYYTAASQAQNVNYSIPLARIPAQAMTQAWPSTTPSEWVEAVNPDGTITVIQNWQVWPIATDDASFRPPANQAMWLAALSAVGLSPQVMRLQCPPDCADYNPTYFNPAADPTPNPSTDISGGSNPTTSVAAACTNGFSMAGFCVPYWAVAVGVGLFLMRGK